MSIEDLQKQGWTINDQLEQEGKPSQVNNLDILKGRGWILSDNPIVEPTPEKPNILQKGAKMLSDAAGRVKDYVGLPNTEAVAKQALDFITEPWFQREPIDPNASYGENVAKGLRNTMKAMIEVPAMAVKMPAQIARATIGEPLQRAIEGGPEAKPGEAPRPGFLADVARAAGQQIKGLGEMIVSGIPGLDPKWAENLFENPDMVVFGKTILKDAAKKAIKSIRNEPPLGKLNIEEALVNPDVSDKDRRLAGTVMGSRMRANTAEEKIVDPHSIGSWDRYVDDRIQNKLPIDPKEFDDQMIAAKEAADEFKKTPDEQKQPEMINTELKARLAAMATEPEAAPKIELKKKTPSEIQADKILKSMGIEPTEPIEKIPLTKKPEPAIIKPEPEKVEPEKPSPTISEKEKAVTDKEIEKLKADELLTSAGRSKLAELGYDKSDIDKMTAIQARDILRDKIKKPIKPAELEKDLTKSEAALARMGLEEAKPKENLRVAVRHGGETYTETITAKTHDQIIEANGLGKEARRLRGFQLPNGLFVGRGDASVWVKKYQPEVWDRLDSDNQKSLHSEAYAAALEGKPMQVRGLKTIKGEKDDLGINEGVSKIPKEYFGQARQHIEGRTGGVEGGREAQGRISEEAAAEEFAKATGTWIDGDTLKHQHELTGGLHGAEHWAIFEPKAQTYTKIAFRQLGGLKEYLRRMSEYKNVPGHVPTELIGFTKIDNRVMPVVRQPDLGKIHPTEVQLNKHFNDHGWIGASGRYKNPRLGLLLTDVQPFNARLINGRVFVFDTYADRYKSEEFSSRDWAKQRELEAINKLRLTKVGPGAMTRLAEEGETPTNISQLEKALNTNLKENKTLNIDEHLTKGEQIAQMASHTKTGAGKAIEGLKGMWAAVKNSYKDMREIPDFKTILGNNMAENTKILLRVDRLAKNLIKSLPNKIQREAIFNWIESGGDEGYIRDAARLTPDKYKPGWNAALKLTPQERLWAGNVRNYFDSMLQEAIDAGMLRDGATDYIMRIVKPDSKAGKRWQAEVNAGLLKRNPTFVKRRMFETIIEGERAGVNYVKDVGQSIAAYSQSFYKAISARKTIRDLLKTGVASDGKPLATIIGGSIKAEMEGTPEAYIIKPRLIPEKAMAEDGNPYRVIDHPALREWKWMGNDAEGKPIIMQGDVAVHPEIYQHLKNILGTSAIRQTATGSAILKGVREFKSTLLSMSGFHQVQEALHAAFHLVKPWDLPEIDLNNKKQYNLVRGSLMVYDHNALENFAEGVAGTGLIQRLPIVGGMFHKYNTYLFTDYIPRLKMKMALAALERNTERYSKTHSMDAIYYKTAVQANAAFGELNYKMMGRSQTLQDALRLMTLAPDFLEARGRFVLQAMKGGGREQAYALIRGALGLYVGARIANTILDGDPHYDKPLSVVIGGKEFMFRSVPGDLYHLFHDPRSFIYHRLNPTVTRTIAESITGRDFLGRKRNFEDQIKDFVTTHIPIPIQAPFDKLMSGRERGLWESALNSIGVQTYDYHSTAEMKARELMMDKGPFSYTEHSKKVNQLLQQLDKESITHKDIDSAYSKGEINRDDYRKILKEHAKSSIVRSIEHLEIPDIKEVWDKMTDTEKMQAKPLIRKKLYNKWRKLTESERADFRPFMREMQ